MRFALLVALASSLASGATVSGRIQDAGGNGVAGMQVRLWGPTPKGYSSLAGYTTTADGAGNFTFGGVADGAYLLDTRMPNGVDGNWGDRWYDSDGDGYEQSGADVLNVTAAGLSGLVITVEQLGGMDGRAVNTSSAPQGGLIARAELMSNRAVHHNDTTKSIVERPGEFSFRGLRTGPTRLVLHDPNFTFADTVVPNYGISGGNVLQAGNVTMQGADNSAHEPNNSDADSSSGIDSTLFRSTPPQPYDATATIGPRSAQDTDWYCFDALRADRYLVTVRGTLTLEDNSVVTSPWVDPMVSLWSGGSLLAQNDDGPGLGLGSRLDTGELGSDGRYCVVVSTFGDSSWNGAGQTSAGPYALHIEMGNRRPLLTVTLPNGTPLNGPVTIDETDSIGFRFNFLDPDQNLTGGSVEIRDASGNVVGGATMNVATGSYVINWTASQTSARNGPYEFVGTVTDGEFTATATATVIVNGVNLPPTVPVLKSPDAGAIVGTRTPDLVCLEGTDPDEETLTYEFELTLVADGGVLNGSVAGVTGGWKADAGTPRPEVTFTTPLLPENAQVRWRARSFDGTASNGHSPWTNVWTFFVDSSNDAPTMPVLTKPTNGETILVRKATLQATNPIDPEGDAVTLQFEVASDMAFTTLIETSAPVPTALGSTTTMYTMAQNLEWGGSYFARARGFDSRGAETPYSNVNQFNVRANSSPTAPALGSPFNNCGATGFTVTQPPGQITVPNVNDVEMDVITVEVQLFHAADDPATATPLFATTVNQQGALDTIVLFTGVQWENGDYRVRTRFKDPYNTTAWTECVFTLAVAPPRPDAGISDAGTGGGSGSDAGVADAGTGGSGGGSTQAAKPGCGCSSADPLSMAALFMVLAQALRSRRRH